MIQHDDLTQHQQFEFLKKGLITLAGNRKLKIYGKLNCASGKRMKKKSRIFLADEAEALALGFRPCGHCMRTKYQLWKISKKRVEKASRNFQF